MSMHDMRKPPALPEDLSRRARRLLLDAIEQIDGDAGGDRAALIVAASATPIAPARLAAAHAKAGRGQARALYDRCLAHYRHLVPSSPAGVDDVGRAVAHFVAANLRALHGVDVTPQALLRLERQLAGVARLSSAWDTAPARERQFYFEQMAILAVLIAESAAQALMQGPAARANVQRAARGYVQRLLGLEPDHLTLDADGLALRAQPVPAEAA